MKYQFISILIFIFLFGTIIPSCVSSNENLDETVISQEDIDWWSMFHHDLQNTGYSTSIAPNTNNILWNFDIAVNDNGYANNPIVCNGKIYFMSTTNSVYCLDSINGEIIWSKKLGDIQIGYWNSIPTIYNNKLFVCGYDDKIYCLNASNGGIIWSSIPIYSQKFSPKVSYGKIYVGSYSNSFYCLNVSNGAIIWSFTIDLLPSSPAIFNEKVYIFDTHGKMFCLDAFSGEKIWTYDTGGSSTHTSSSPVIYNNKVYIINLENFYGGYLNCLDAYNGTLLWRNQIPAYGMGHFSPTVAYGNMYIGSSIGSLYCLNADTGSYIWGKEFGGLEYSSPAIADGKLYFGTIIHSATENSKIVCINAYNGSFIWSYKIVNSLLDISAIADGKLYCSSGSKIYCFGDNIPPEVEIVSPKKDTLYLFNKNIPFLLSVIIGSINIEINASDKESGLDFVKLYIDNVEKKNFSAHESFIWKWDDITFRKHIIKAIACDKVGNVAEYTMTVWKFF